MNQNQANLFDSNEAVAAGLGEITKLFHPTGKREFIPIADETSRYLLRTVETPLARASDPITSHIAAAEHTASGNRARQQHQTIAAVRAYPGRTSQELAQLTRLDRYMLARRLPECVTAGAVRRGAISRCSVTGKLALTWYPV